MFRVWWFLRALWLVWWGHQKSTRDELYYNSPAWDEVLAKINFCRLSFKQQLWVGRLANNKKVWFAIIDNPELSAEHLFLIGDAVGHWDDIWRRMIRAGKFSRGQLIDIGNTIGWGYVAEEAIPQLNLGQLLFDQQLEIGQKAKNWRVWLAIVEEGNPSDKQLFVVGREAKNCQVWLGVVKNKQLSFNQRVEACKEANIPAVWDAFLNPYLGKFTLMRIGREVSCFYVWRIIAKNIDLKQLSPDQRIELAQGSEDNNVWLAVLMAERELAEK